MVPALQGRRGGAGARRALPLKRQHPSAVPPIHLPSLLRPVTKYRKHEGRLSYFERQICVAGPGVYSPGQVSPWAGLVGRRARACPTPSRVGVRSGLGWGGQRVHICLKPRAAHLPLRCRPAPSCMQYQVPFCLSLPKDLLPSSHFSNTGFVPEAEKSR